MPAIGDLVPRCLIFNLRPTLFMLKAVSIYISLLSRLYFTDFQYQFLEGAQVTQHVLPLPSVLVLCKVTDFRLAISIAHSSTSSTTSVFIPSIALFVSHVGLPSVFDVETDSCIVGVPVGVVIRVRRDVDIATGDASVNPDTTV
jgi:hypothetical protein